MQNKEPSIVWEKWVDPYGRNLDSVEWPGHDQDNIINEDEYEEDQTKSVKYNRINAVATSMGIVPFNEHTDCTKIFNFWLGHTNFNITKHIADILQSVDGVETLDIFTRYRFRISFGKAFDERHIINNINSVVKNL
jgi:hypothetical protein